MLKSVPTPILSFNFNDQYDLQGIVQALAMDNSPGILMVSEKAIQFSGLDYLFHLFTAARKQTCAQLFLQLDHCKDYTLISRCIELGFDLVMADFSDDDVETNIQKTSEVVRLAHSRGVLVEGEIGKVPFLTPGEKFSTTDSSLTSLIDAVEFVRQTGVDLLAVAVGNAHGVGPPKPRIDLKHLASLRRNLNVPLVLHGADFYSNSELSSCIEMGIEKLNFGPELRVVYTEALVEFSRDYKVLTDHRPLLGAIREKIEQRVTQWLSSLQIIVD